MVKAKSRYKRMEYFMSHILLGDTACFLIFLLFSSIDVPFLKVLFSVLAITISALCLIYLLLTQELLKTRSRWMSAAAAAILVCTVVSLVLKYPAPPL